MIETSESIVDLIGALMKECSEHFLMQFGVKGECSPAIGDVWLKD